MYGICMEDHGIAWKIHLGALIFTCFWALGPVRGRLGGHLRGALKKTWKNHFWRPSFWPKFGANVGTFLATFFTCFLRPLAFHLCAPAGRHMTQFRRLLATNLRTDWANQQKWKQWFRVGESIKIKPFRTWNCASFLTFSYACCKPLFFVILEVSLSHSSEYGYPCELHFARGFAIISTSFLWWFFDQKGRSKWNLEGGHLRHITGKGGTRRHPQAPRSPERFLR